MTKKILSMLVLFVLLQNIAMTNNIAVANVPVSKMKDVSSSHKAYQQVEFMVSNHYMELYDDATFKPQKDITRAEAASTLAKSIGVNLETTFVPKCKDVPKDHPYAKEIYKMIELGVFQNTEQFKPEQPLKRSQVAKLLALSFKMEVDSVNKTKFKDVYSNHWAKDYIESLADMGIIHGTSKQYFSPNAAVTRVQMATLMKRSIDFTEKVKNLEMAYDFLSKDYIPTVNLSNAWSEEVVRLVNIERQKQDLPALTYDKKLTQIAVIKSQDMVNRGYFEHVSPYYGAPWDLATLFDFPFTSFGENIARRIPNPSATVRAWMNSPTHRENIMRANYTCTGVAVSKDHGNNYYWVQMFASQ